jgi:hypothetical protein
MDPPREVLRIGGPGPVARVPGCPKARRARRVERAAQTEYRASHGPGLAGGIVHARYDAGQVADYFAAATQAALVLGAFRAPYRGRSTPVNAWWGSFDLAVGLFSGRSADPTSDEFIMRNAGTAQQVEVGWWPGDARYGKAAFYAYAYPAPEGFAGQALGPSAARSAIQQPWRSTSPGRRSGMRAWCAGGIQVWPPALSHGRRPSPDRSPASQLDASTTPGRGAQADQSGAARMA